MRLVITGTGRSGTGYMAEILRASGVVCGHEGVFTTAAVLGRSLPAWGEYEADSSWLAVPLLPWMRVERQQHVVLVVRRPLAVVRSFLALGVFDRWDDYQAVVREATPLTLAEPTAADRALAHWCAWNVAASLSADEVVRIEDLHPDRVVPWVQALGRDPAPVEEAFKTVPRNVNARTEAKQGVGSIMPSLFRPPILETARRIAAGFGYRDDWAAR